MRNDYIWNFYIYCEQGSFPILPSITKYITFSNIFERQSYDKKNEKSRKNYKI